MRSKRRTWEEEVPFTCFFSRRFLLGSVAYKMGNSVAVATQFVLVCIVTIFIAMVLDPQVLFLWHPTLMMFAFGFVMSEGK